MMLLLPSVFSLLAILPIAFGSPTLHDESAGMRSRQLDNRSLSLPLSTNGHYIVDAQKKNVAYVGINWPGAADVMIPEGLQYQSVQSIVSKVAATGFTVVRLTYAIEMIDDVLDNGGDVTIENALKKALGARNGATVLAKMLKANPKFKASTTRLQIFDAVAEELGRQGIYVHLDNHVSKGTWCCSQTDGNAWFGDTYFDTTKWMRGLAYMANHGKAWPSFASMGLRNELREPQSGHSGLQAYTWTVWEKYMTAAADGIHKVNPDVLMTFSGFNYDTDISEAVSGKTGSTSFSVKAQPYANKLVWEHHEYDYGGADKSCSSYESSLDGAEGGVAELSSKSGNLAPIVMSEWGHDETDGSGQYKNPYHTCINEFFVARKMGWMLWDLAGSYYIRSGSQDVDETWGILNHDWSSFRGNAAYQTLKKNVANSKAAIVG